MGDKLPYADLGPGNTAAAVEVSSNRVLLTNGLLKCWLENAYSYETTTALVNVDSAHRAIALSGTCALLDNQQVTCLGYDPAGPTGSGLEDIQVVGKPKPVDLGVGETARTLSSGGARCIILGNGKLKCWDGLDDTQDGAVGAVPPYVDLGTDRTVLAVASRGHTCAVLDNGRVKCWGANDSGQLGLGYTKNRGDVLTEMGDRLPYVDLGGEEPPR